MTDFQVLNSWVVCCSRCPSFLPPEMTKLLIVETRKEKDRQIADKEAIIADQARRMDHMALEFTEMLKETLEKMSERMEESASQMSTTPLGGDRVQIDPKYIPKLKEFNIVIS